MFGATVWFMDSYDILLIYRCLWYPTNKRQKVDAEPQETACGRSPTFLEMKITRKCKTIWDQVPSFSREVKRHEEDKKY